MSDALMFAGRTDLEWLAMAAELETLRARIGELEAWLEQIASLPNRPPSGRAQYLARYALGTKP